MENDIFVVRKVLRKGLRKGFKKKGSFGEKFQHYSVDINNCISYFPQLKQAFVFQNRGAVRGIFL